MSRRDEKPSKPVVRSRIQSRRSANANSTPSRRSDRGRRTVADLDRIRHRIQDARGDVSDGATNGRSLRERRGATVFDASTRRLESKVEALGELVRDMAARLGRIEEGLIEHGVVKPPVEPEVPWEELPDADKVSTLMEEREGLIARLEHLEAQQLQQLQQPQQPAEAPPVPASSPDQIAVPHMTADPAAAQGS